MKKIVIIFGVLIALLMAGCSAPTNPAQGNVKALTAFSFMKDANNVLEKDVTGRITGTDITLTVPYGTDVRRLKASFTSIGKSVVVDNTPQKSGTTINNFSKPVSYIITAEDGRFKRYTVKVKIDDTKTLTVFSFMNDVNDALGKNIAGQITGTKIMLTVPVGTDVTELKATFTTTGKSVAIGSTSQTSGTTANDFSKPVTYTVTAKDGTTQDYTVTVENPAASEDAVFTQASKLPGNAAVLTLKKSSRTLKMIHANNLDKVTFPIKGNDTKTTTLTHQFWMGETEVTNAVFVAVYQWAYNHDKFSTTVSDPNGLDITTAKHGGQELVDLDDDDCRVDYDGSGVFSVEAKYEAFPVTNVTGYGAVMFCNWLTGMRDGNMDNVVYSGMDVNWVARETVEDVSKNGYRLPSLSEWEYAARYRGTNTDNVVTGTIQETDFTAMELKWTKGNSASGATANYKNASATDKVAVYGESWDGNKWISTGTSDEVAVKSKAPNTLGLYDMSGNVWEWCFTVGATRASRGGSWHEKATSQTVGNMQSDDNPNYEDGYLGFRLCRTADPKAD